jgi:RNA polymerase sigma-70 factor (ECF subfamily)
LEENKDSRVLPEASRADETTLVARSRQGDKAAFGMLVKMHHRRLLRTVTAMIGDLDGAKDIVQESFLRAYQALSRFEEGQPFYPWLSRIAVNLAINQIKRGGRQTRLDPDRHEHASDAPDPLAKLQVDENDRRFLAAVHDLPEPFRSVFVLRQFEDLSYEEIAMRLNISVGTVDSRLFRARRQLVESLQDLLE